MTNHEKIYEWDDYRYVPTPLEISEFKSALARGFKDGERSPAIHRWANLKKFGATGFFPTTWAYKLLESGDCLHLDYGGIAYWHIYIVSETKLPSLRGEVRMANISNITTKQICNAMETR